jgi:ribosomal protein RSM22 (predicted rRNA methylase)
LSGEKIEATFYDHRMQLPRQLQQAIEAEAVNIGLATLAQAANELSANYRFRQGSAQKFIETEAHRIAYVATRMPATYATIHKVLREIPFAITSLLDLGAGPGTAAWAAAAMCAELQSITLLERDRELIALGKAFAAQSDHEALRAAEWVAQDLTNVQSLPRHDLVVCSYALGELPNKTVRAVVETAWQAAEQAIVLIEPGTMKGFALMREWREELLRSGGHVLAPCPHADACPMPENDWCHFAARVERTALHRQLKAAALGYEDEKFSYVVIAKHPVKSGSARIVRRPNIQSGFVQLSLCASDGLQNVTVTRRDKDKFKRARKAAWGEAWTGD